MGVDYKSVLHYGYNLTNKINEIPENFIDLCQQAGFDVIYDAYGDSFLYVGINISCCEIYEQSVVDITAITQNDGLGLNFKINYLLAKKSSDNIRQYFNDVKNPHLYHICYAT